MGSWILDRYRRRGVGSARSDFAPIMATAHPADLVRRRRSWCEVGVGEASVTQSILSNPRGTAVTEVVIA